MSSTYLTPTIITREALRILHQKLNFIGSINRQYDSRFGNTGAKIGDTLTIRLPNKYTVTTGAVLSAQDVTEPSTTLTVSTQKHVGMRFGMADLTLKIDDFSKRYLEPAMAVLAASMEADACSMYKDVYNQVNNLNAAATHAKLAECDKKLFDNLTPESDRVMNLDSQTHMDLIDAWKALFHEDKTVSRAFKEARIGHAMGFDFFRNTHWNRHTSGTENGASLTLTVSGANQTGASVTVTNGSSKTLKKGDIITFPGVNRVHPETKVDTGVKQQFVVTADVGSSGTSIPISPSIITSGATQNVSASPTDSTAIDTKIGGASEDYGISLAYHPDAFTFATADLVMPKGVDFSAREVYDGISMRVVRQYDINNDQLPCRIDVLYGYKTIRPEMATRWANN
jgi:hypothetical protein